MPSKKAPPPPPYPPEFRARMVEPVRAGQTPEELARKFEPSAGAIRNWVRQADLVGASRRKGCWTMVSLERKPAPSW